MNRLEKKCFATVASAHGLMLLILIIGPGFFMAPEKNDAFKQITVYSAADISKALTGGETPQPVRAVPLPPPSTPVAEPKPVEPTPKPPEIPKPVKPEPKDLRTPEPEIKIKPVSHGDQPVVKPKKHVVELDPNDLAPNNKNSVDKAKAEKQAEADRRARAKAAADARQRDKDLKELGNAVKSLQKDMSGSTLVRMPEGAGGGGAASVNYRDLIASKFYSAWNPSFNLSEDTPDVTISITITRDGNVTGHITKPSGNANMDKSVQRALDAVSFIEPFPSSFTEQRMTIPVIFNLHAKRQ